MQRLSFWMVNEESKCLDPLWIPAHGRINIFNEIFNRSSAYHGLPTPFPQMPFLSILWHTVCSSVWNCLHYPADGRKSNQKAHFESIILLIPHRNASEVSGEEHFADSRRIQRKHSVWDAEWQLYSDQTDRTIWRKNTIIPQVKLVHNHV